MHRRDLLRGGAGLTAALTASRNSFLNALDKAAKSSVNTKAIDRYRSQIGIQLYTLRNQISADVKGTIQAVADAGYYF